MTEKQKKKFEEMEKDRKRCDFFCIVGYALMMCGAFSFIFIIIGILLILYWDPQSRDITESDEYRSLKLCNAYEKELNG